jgi:hypothetical protein
MIRRKQAPGFADARALFAGLVLLVGRVRNSIAYRLSPLPTPAVPAWPAFPRPDL